MYRGKEKPRTRENQNIEGRCGNSRFLLFIEMYNNNLRKKRKKNRAT